MAGAVHAQAEEAHGVTATAANGLSALPVPTCERRRQDHQPDSAGLGELLCHWPLESVLSIRQALGGAEDTASPDASPEAPRLWLGAVEYAVAARDLGAVPQLPNAPRSAESTLGCIGLITRGLKQTGERSARKTARYVRRGGGWKRGMVEMLGHSQPKGRATGNPNLDLHRRASPRPYQLSAWNRR